MAGQIRGLLILGVAESNSGRPILPIASGGRMTVMRVSAEAVVGNRLTRGTVYVLSFCVLLSWSGPAFGLWLPWATDQDKIQKTLNEIWKGLVDKNDELVTANLTGKAVASFINHERDIIDKLKIEKYECRIHSVQFDSAAANWAFVDLEKVATLKGGSQFSSRLLTVLKKVDGEWQLVTGTGKHRKVQRAKEDEAKSKQKNPASGEPGAFSPAMNYPPIRPAR